MQSFGGLDDLGALFGDQFVDPLEVVLGRTGPVLEERPGVAVDGAARTAAGAGEPLGQLVAPALEQREAVVAAEVPAERELERERALVVGLVVGEQLGEGARDRDR